MYSRDSRVKCGELSEEIHESTAGQKNNIRIFAARQKLPLGDFGRIGGKLKTPCIVQALGGRTQLNVQAYAKVERAYAWLPVLQKMLAKLSFGFP
eukprot:6154106-Amphidinium_carterae.1